MMLRHIPRRALTSASLVAILGCSEPTAPEFVRPPDAVDVTMHFCLGDEPVWFAFRNDGYDWWAVDVPPFARFVTFPATARVTVALLGGVPEFGFTDLKILYSTAAELSSFACRSGETGLKAVNAPVRMSDARDRVRIGMAGGSAFVAPFSPTSPRVIGVPDGPVDLVALLEHDPEVGGEPLAILRHGLDVPDGGSVPVVDFTSEEARPLEHAVVTIDGGTSASAYARTELWTALGTHMPTATTFGADAGVPIDGFAPALLAEEDIHQVQIFQDGLALTYFTHAVRDTTVRLGPVLQTAVLTMQNVSGAPTWRARLPWQAAYPSIATLWYVSASDDLRQLTVEVTSGYTGGAAADWDLAVPDLSGARGFSASWLPVLDESTTYAVGAFQTRFEMLHGAARPMQGEVVRSASQFGSLNGSSSARVLMNPSYAPYR